MGDTVHQLAGDKLGLPLRRIAGVTHRVPAMLAA
ncbi:hypothetical protein STAFG_5774 [Streptomyces afghaniensis 772]|uniref:HPt domain-containing protein n=1 Tax=Streptomyces afghaniensis 772 TaxID=1283301 RepID=S4MU46_9ACTN|nr:hypothetical protein STAFG_5774 [Streptomyces afghaniensis 772]